MQITHPCLLLGETDPLNLPVPCEQCAAQQDDDFVHVIFYHLPTWDHESILTRIKRAEWDALFPLRS